MVMSYRSNIVRAFSKKKIVYEILLSVTIKIALYEGCKVVVLIRRPYPGQV